MAGSPLTLVQQDGQVQLQLPRLSHSGGGVSEGDGTPDVGGVSLAFDPPLPFPFRAFQDD